MAHSRKKSNKNETNDAMFQHFLMDSENYENDRSDSDGENRVEEWDLNSDTEQECYSSESDQEDKNDYYIGKDKTSKWRKTKFAHLPKIRPQNVPPQGVVGPATQAKTVLECWNCFIDDRMLDGITLYTNEYIKNIQSSYLRERDAKFTDVVEVKAFIGLLYLSGVLKLNRRRIEEMWSDDGYGIELLRLVMSLRRFKFLLRCVCFDDYRTQEPRKRDDELAPIQDVFSNFVDNCKRNYSLGPNVTIGEMLTSFRGKCSFAQYIPRRPGKHGIKTFCLVDAQTFYTYNMEIYPGKDYKGPLSYEPADIAKRLAEPIYNTGRNITADKRYTNFELVTFLKSQNLSYVGALKKTDQQMPSSFVRSKNRCENSSLFGFQEDATIVSHLKKDQKNALVISSMHFDDSVDENTGDKRRPKIVTFFDETKCAVDLVSQMCAKYNVQRCHQRWPLIMFFALMNICAINAQVIYLSNGNAMMKRRLFLKHLVKEIVDEHMKRRAADNTGMPISLQEKLQKSTDVRPEVAAAHASNKRKCCAPCSRDKLRRYTKYHCKACTKFLCLEHATMVCESCYCSAFEKKEEQEQSD